MAVEAANPPDPGARTVVFDQSAPGPVEPGSHLAVTATCPLGTGLISGGVSGDLETGKPPTPSLRLHGTFPSGAGGLPAGSGDRPSGWTVLGATGGQPERDARTSAYVVCGNERRSRTVVMTKSVPGPAGPASSSTATATCPADAPVVGGGGRLDLDDGSPAPRHFFLSGSFPSDATGQRLASGRPRSWTAIGAIGGTPMQHGRVTAFVVCALEFPGQTEVAVSSQRGPAAPAAFVRTTVTCPVGQALLGGGAYSGLPGGGSPPQGLHLRGSFPSDSNGASMAGGARPTSWSAVANAGGMVVIGARTFAFAVCAG